MRAIRVLQPKRPAGVPSLRAVAIIRFVLPLALCLLALGFEFGEHGGASDTDHANWPGMSEMVIFGMLGPAAVFATMTYVVALLREIEAVHSRVTELNQGLEQLVAERTTDLRTSNAELAQANRQLHELDQMKSDFVALVSHELRAPLATLNGGLEVALQHPDDLPLRARRVLDLVMGETLRLTQFVQTVLDVSQLEAGKLRMNYGPLAVRPLLRRAAEIVFGPDDQRVVWRLPASLPPAWGDEIYAEEAIRNLLRNAQKYTPPHSPIELTALHGDHCMRVCITDYGPGIPAAAQEHIFERFYQAGQSDEYTPRGWGLGLHFARSLLVAQGGSLALESPAHADPDAPGARFIVELPIAEEVQEDGKAAVD
ncbi:MAG: HAMP domain-containing sensor histidine kinase [Chloroflexales bacterium]